MSGAPSTMWALVRGDDPMAATVAAGRMVLPRSADRVRLFAAAGIAHIALSLGWAVVIARLQPRGWSARRAVVLGAVSGSVIAGLDLGTAHRCANARLSGIRALPVVPQIADHIAYGVVVAAALARADVRSDRSPRRSS
jgi:drug/metabolite transporter superfamily protein YnfA